ncbi:MAG: hypothetical protein LBQ88_15865 [Treponema sp.]|jgi:hypothetical protein|nr:hypothetical protein [Treponema sp.]
MTVEELRDKLEMVISNLTSSGFGNADPGVMEALDGYAVAAGELGMKSGKKLVENLSAVLKSRKSGESTDESVSVRITAMDFYLKNIQSGTEEEL